MRIESYLVTYMIQIAFRWFSRGKYKNTISNIKGFFLLKNALTFFSAISSVIFSAEHPSLLPLFGRRCWRDLLHRYTYEIITVVAVRFSPLRSHEIVSVLVVRSSPSPSSSSLWDFPSPSSWVFHLGNVVLQGNSITATLNHSFLW